jgi:hypothetical protein
MFHDILDFGVVRNVECESGNAGRVWELFNERLELLEAPATHSEREFATSGM